jgi:hypothetical protein
MRQGQPNQHHNHNNNNKNRMRNRNRKGPNPLQRSYESNGGDVKIRGTALHVAEKYVQLARDAQSSGDRVAGENYLQHAEHYYRIVAAAQAQMPQPQQIYRNDDGDDDEGEDRDGNVGGYNANNNGGNPGYRDNSNYGGNNNYQGGNNNYQGNRPQQGGGQQGGGQQGGGHVAYGIPDQAPPVVNGDNGAAPNQIAQDQPPFEGSPQGEQRGDDNRGQGGGQGPGGHNPRHRRRRPFRDQYGSDRNAGGPVPPMADQQGDGGQDVQGDD